MSTEFDRLYDIDPIGVINENLKKLYGEKRVTFAQSFLPHIPVEEVCSMPKQELIKVMAERMNEVRVKILNFANLEGHKYPNEEEVVIGFIKSQSGKIRGGNRIFDFDQLKKELCKKKKEQSKELANFIQFFKDDLEQTLHVIDVLSQKA